MSRPLVIYHAHCADGWTAAWVAQRFFQAHHYGGCDLVAASYGDDPPPVAGRFVVILDFSYPRETLLEMHRQAAELVVLDHHQSAARALEGLPFARFDMAQSGAGMAWEHFFGTAPRPWLVDYVEDRDLWRWALPESRAVSAYLRTVPLELETWTAVEREGLEEAKARGRSILAYVDALVRSHVERAAPAMLGGHLVPVVNASAVVSNPDHVDVSEVARAFGGGGHRHAAGFRSSGPVHVAEDVGGALHGGGGGAAARPRSTSTTAPEKSPRIASRMISP